MLHLMSHVSVRYEFKTKVNVVLCFPSEVAKKDPITHLLPLNTFHLQFPTNHYCTSVQKKCAGHNRLLIVIYCQIYMLDKLSL